MAGRSYVHRNGHDAAGATSHRGGGAPAGSHAAFVASRRVAGPGEVGAVAAPGGVPFHAVVRVGVVRGVEPQRGRRQGLAVPPPQPPARIPVVVVDPDLPQDLGPAAASAAGPGQPAPQVTQRLLRGPLAAQRPQSGHEFVPYSGVPQRGKQDQGEHEVHPDPKGQPSQSLLDAACPFQHVIDELEGHMPGELARWPGAKTPSATLTTRVNTVMAHWRDNGTSHSAGRPWSAYCFYQRSRSTFRRHTTPEQSEYPSRRAPAPPDDAASGFTRLI
jgi:hypothetical protein